MYWEDGDQLMNRPIVAVVDFCLLLAYVRKSLLLSQASFLQFDTHTGGIGLGLQSKFSGRFHIHQNVRL